MAITPKQAMTLTAEQNRKVDAEEQRIDRELQGMADNERRKVRMPYGFTDQMYNQLKARYTAVGWNVIKSKKTEYDEQPGNSGSSYEVDAWEFGVASTIGCDEERMKARWQ